MLDGKYIPNQTGMLVFSRYDLSLDSKYGLELNGEYGLCKDTEVL